MLLKNKNLDLSSPKIMGILNLTPDSFSDGGLYLKQDQALYQIEQMIADWKPFPNWSKYFTEVKREDKNRLKALLDGKIAEVGRKETARRLQENAEGINHMADEILYSSDEDAVNMDLNYIATVLKGSPLTADESAYYTQLAESYNESE